ncbi:MAG: hypothetical protein JSS51_15560 [Planctomycetes bacterium]|nr:hypothetical protein [Planctomycetota bacterium]
MSQSHQHAKSVRAGVAGLVFVLGVTWAGYSIFHGSRNSTVIALPSTGKEKVILAPTPPPVVIAAKSDEGTADRVSATIKAKLKTVPISQPSSSEAAAIASESAETLDLASNPTVEKYLSYLEHRGEPNGYFAKLSQHERETYLRSKSQSFAGQDFDFDKAQVRWRYIDGKEIDVPKEIGGYATPKRTFDAIMNPSVSGLTVMEVIVPVPAKTVAMGIKPCRLGIWIGKTRENPSWTTMRIYTYDVPGNAGVVSPPL